MKYAARMLAIAAVITPLLASAQLGSQRKIVAQVPFEFHAGNKIVPAGKCTVQLVSPDSTTLTIRNSDAKMALFAGSRMDTPPKGSTANMLVFHRYGARYFLSEIRVAGSSFSYRLPESTNELELRAQNVPVSEQILLAQRY